MANPLTADQQTLSDSLRGKGGWKDGEGCFLLVNRPAWDAGEWHACVCRGGGAAVDMTDGTDVDLSENGLVAYLDLTTDTLAGYLAVMFREATTSQVVVAYSSGVGWTMSLDGAADLSGGSFAELLATALDAAMA